MNENEIVERIKDLRVQKDQIEQEINGLESSIASLPLKLYGTITKVGIKYRFKFANHCCSFDTIEAANKYQLDVSRQYPRNNLYRNVNGTIHIHLKNNVLIISMEDFDKVVGRVWYERKKSAYTQSVESRVNIDVHLFGVSMIHKNGNRYDCRRENVEAKVEKEIVTNDLEVDYLHLQITSHDVLLDYQRMKGSTSMYATSIGGKFTNHFMFDPMSLVKKKGMPNYHEAISNPKYLSKILDKINAYSTSKIISSNVVYKYWGYCFYKPGNFPSYIARQIYDGIGKKNLNILDFSSGFGGRLTGFWMSDSVQSYTGIDPNTLLFPCYEKMINWLIENDPKQKYVRLIHGCAEQVDLLDEEPTMTFGKQIQIDEYDMCFTSPPYFDLEVYSNEETQSCNRYTSVEIWLTQFLLATLEKATRVLCRGGILVINIKNSKKWKINVCERMVSFLGHLGMTHFDTLFLKQTSRNGTGDRDEPIWMFRKIDRM
jgi:hypothetical protein